MPLQYSENINSQWRRYSETVKEILEDPETACWLDGPLNPAWFRPFDGRLGNYRKTSAAYKRRRSNFRKILEKLANYVRFMTWILHVTAALAYPMLASTLDNNLTKN